MTPEQIKQLTEPGYGGDFELTCQIGEVGRNDRKCSYCDGTGIKVINGKDKICISCLGKGEGDAW